MKIMTRKQRGCRSRRTLPAEDTTSAKASQQSVLGGNKLTATERGAGDDSRVCAGSRAREEAGSTHTSLAWEQDYTGKLLEGSDI